MPTSSSSSLAQSGLADVIALQPAFEPERIAVHVSRNAERAVRRGELWVFQEAVLRTRGEARAGDIAVLYDAKDKPFALGLWDPNSPLRIRVLSPTLGVQIDDAWVEAAVQRAVEARLAHFDAKETNGYRLLHGPGDGMPGMVVDRYANTCVIKIYSEAWLAWLPVVARTLAQYEGFSCGILRLNRQLQARTKRLAPYREGLLLWGSEEVLTSQFRENGLRFEVDPRLGQKTGFFLDQRENRARVEAIAAGQDTLNVFCYTGGFSLYAARGGAPRVVSVDASQPAMDALARNVHLNKNDASVARARFDNRCVDAFVALEELAKTHRRFGLVIIDPPSFAKRNDEVETALSAYRRLARMAVPLVKEGGTLVFASCSSRIDEAQLEAALLEGAADAKRSLNIYERVGHPFDHPIARGELQYLKTLYARIA